MHAGAVVACLAMVLLLAACRPSAPTTGYTPDPGQVDIDAHLREVGLGSGDVFQVRVYGEEELSGTHRVSPDGTIDFPLVGRVRVDGLTPDEVAERIRDRLKDGYIRDPSVSVYVEEYHSKKIFVLGQVNKPGTFPYSSGMSIVEAITLAGGFRPAANPNYVVVTREDADGNERRIPVPVEKISKGEARNLELRSGDIIFVPDTLL